MGEPSTPSAINFRFSKEEEKLLLASVEPRRDAINGAGAFANRNKQQAWKNIAAHVNKGTLNFCRMRIIEIVALMLYAVCVLASGRYWLFSGKQCKKKYQNIKKERCNEERAQLKIRRKGTGGGAPLKSVFDPAARSVLDADIPSEKIDGVDGGLDLLDDDDEGDEGIGNDEEEAEDGEQQRK